MASPLPGLKPLHPRCKHLRGQTLAGFKSAVQIKGTAVTANKSHPAENSYAWAPLLSYLLQRWRIWWISRFKPEFSYTYDHIDHHQPKTWVKFANKTMGKGRNFISTQCAFYLSSRRWDSPVLPKLGKLFSIKTKLLLIHRELSSLALVLGGFLEAALAGRSSLRSPVDGFALALLLLLLLLIRPPANPPYPCNIRQAHQRNVECSGRDTDPPRQTRGKRSFISALNKQLCFHLTLLRHIFSQDFKLCWTANWSNPCWNDRVNIQTKIKVSKSLLLFFFSFKGAFQVKQAGFIWRTPKVSITSMAMRHSCAPKTASCAALTAGLHHLGAVSQPKRSWFCCWKLLGSRQVWAAGTAHDWLGSSSSQPNILTDSPSAALPKTDPQSHRAAQSSSSLPRPPKRF